MKPTFSRTHTQEQTNRSFQCNTYFAERLLISKEIASIVKDGSVIGTDISAAMIEHASKKYSNQENLKFIVMDASKNIFREQFDIVTSFNCLHWVSDQQNALDGIARASENGAQIALLLSHKKSLYHNIIDNICLMDKWKPYFTDYINPRSFFNFDNYKKLVSQSGLIINEIAEEDMTYVFKTKDQLKSFFGASGSQIKRIPEFMKDSFLEDFANEFIKQSEITEEDPIPLVFSCLQVVATKPFPNPILESSSESIIRPSQTHKFF